MIQTVHLSHKSCSRMFEDCCAWRSDNQFRTSVSFTSTCASHPFAADLAPRLHRLSMDSYDDYYYSSASFFYYSSSDHSAPPNPSPTAPIPIPIDSTVGTPTPIPVRLPPSAAAAAAATKIQSAYRGHLVRALVGRIRAVDAEAARVERRIQRQETVDTVRRDNRERLRVSEALMSLLLRLDSVPGFYPAVRELRRATSRRIVALQEILDAVLKAPPLTGEGITGSWDEILEGLWSLRREEVDTEAATADFDCLERFLLGV